jgi:hypothetical protein
VPQSGPSFAADPRSDHPAPHRVVVSRGSSIAVTSDLTDPPVSDREIELVLGVLGDRIAALFKE